MGSVKKKEVPDGRESLGIFKQARISTGNFGYGRGAKDGGGDPGDHRGTAVF